MSGIWLRVAGYPATEIAAHTPPTWETWADGGSGEASWAFALSPTSQHQALRVNESLVEVMCGPVPLWSGLLGDYDRSTGECSAYGMGTAGQDFLALTSAGASTRDLYVAIGEAMARGWNVTNPIPVSGTVAGEVDGNPVSVQQLLSDAAQQTGQRWGVDGRRRVFVRPEPTSPMWLTSPGAAAFGTTSEDRAGKLYGRYLDLTTGTHQTAVAGSGQEMAVDLTQLGAITSVAATAFLTGMLAREHSRPAWTNGVTLGREQIQTMGGVPAFLPAVVAGQMIRCLGLSNAIQATALDAVIGKTRYTAGEDTIYIEPVNTAPRNFTDVIAAS